ncbi:hypothetical protein L249_3685 [Ophiocordyceps polyrhachis-furcata BCC 54312]|uniref:Uncharacterized protein n=1 Tax=Ophiocordyceps polyrhachis-furcata BCC 54312 TaxID=1330021 RepID=A0A367L4P9_9HYPO|nr:hypothetical protein L249_3685 [Ophiocordyceps polyrhachis-furcata BCC 54312]
MGWDGTYDLDEQNIILPRRRLKKTRVERKKLDVISSPSPSPLHKQGKKKRGPTHSPFRTANQQSTNALPSDQTTKPAT